MKVKELEARLGMSRANIRFYEKEGLLSPNRRANGYRDYTEEDALTLEKIALLRRLEMPVEVIRQVQEDKVSLLAALAQQEQVLSAMQQEMEQARRICGNMLEDQVTYKALEPEKYRNALPPARPRPMQPLPTVTKEPALGHRTRRLLARQLDYWLYRCLWYCLSVRVFHFWGELGFLDMLVAAGLMLLIEPILMTTWGMTPGKWLFGLQLSVSEDGKERLPYGQALLRTAFVLVWSLTLFIPIVNIIMWYRVWHGSANGEEQFWNEDYYYYYLERDHQWLYDIGSAVVAGLSVWLLILNVSLPNKGPVTREEYVANVNQYMMMDQEEGRLEEDGFWLNADLKPRHRIKTDEQGYVTQVEMQMGQREPEQTEIGGVTLATENRYSMYTCYKNLHLCMMALTGRRQDEGVKQLTEWAECQNLNRPPQEAEMVCGQWKISIEELSGEDSDGYGPYLLRVSRVED